jgi:uncharacterized protein with HEPN domain
MAVRKYKNDPLLPIYVHEMIQAIEQILVYSAGHTFDTFFENKMLNDAVQRQFEILGEATTHVPNNIQRKFKTIPWDSMYSLRNHIAHEYFDVDHEIIWEIIKNDLPKDLENLKEIKLPT